MSSWTQKPRPRIFNCLFLSLSNQIPTQRWTCLNTKLASLISGLSQTKEKQKCPFLWWLIGQKNTQIISRIWKNSVRTTRKIFTTIVAIFLEEYRMRARRILKFWEFLLQQFSWGWNPPMMPVKTSLFSRRMSRFYLTLKQDLLVALKIFLKKMPNGSSRPPL